MNNFSVLSHSEWRILLPDTWYLWNMEMWTTRCRNSVYPFLEVLSHIPTWFCGLCFWYRQWSIRTTFLSVRYWRSRLLTAISYDKKQYVRVANELNLRCNYEAMLLQKIIKGCINKKVRTSIQLYYQHYLLRLLFIFSGHSVPRLHPYLNKYPFFE